MGVRIPPGVVLLLLGVLLITELPIQFPSEADRIYREAMEFRKLSSSERFMRIFSLCAAGETLLQHSPRREQALAQRRASEEEWRRIQKELFKRHGV